MQNKTNKVVLFNLKHFQLLIIWHLALIVSIHSYQTPLFAQQNNNTLLILDGSRSMWGKFGSTRKYKAMIAETKKLLSQENTNQKIGIITFGNTRRRNCRDINILKPLAEKRSENTLQKLDKFKPIGAAPISLALEKAAEILPKGQFNKIVLIADGYDSCRKNPCKAIGSLQNKYNNLLIDIIALNIRKRDQRRYQCLDKYTLVRQHFVKNEKGLSNALANAFNNIIEQKENTLPKDPSIEKQRIETLLSGKPRLKLLAVQVRGATPLRNSLTWEIFIDNGNNPLENFPVARSTDSQPLIELKPGKYLVRAQYGKVKKTQVVNVPEKGSITHIFNMNAGILNLKIIDTSNNAPIENVTYAITSQITEKKPRIPIIRGRKQISNLQLPAGRYIITTTFAGLPIIKNIRINAGQITSEEIKIDIGTVKLSTSAYKGSKPLQNITYTIYRGAYENNKENLEARNEIIRTAAARPEIKLQAGKYTILAEHELIDTTQVVLIQTGKTTNTNINLQAGNLKLSSFQINEQLKYDISYQILKKHKGRYKEISRTYQADKTYLLPPGKYKILGRYGKTNAVKSINISLKKNERKEIKVQHTTGEVSLALIDKRHKLPKVSVFWQIYDQTDQEIWSSTQATPSLILQKGKYKVVVENNDQSYQQSFKIKNGQKSRINIFTN